MITRATASNCCWPPEELAGDQVLLADNVEGVELVRHNTFAFGFPDVAVRKVDTQVLGDGQVLEQVELPNNESDVALVEGCTLFGRQAEHGLVQELIRPFPVAVEKAQHG